MAKNTILKRAIEGNSQWEVVGEKLEASNMWFFVGSDLKVGREGRMDEDISMNRGLCGTGKALCGEACEGDGNCQPRVALD